MLYPNLTNDEIEYLTSYIIVTEKNKKEMY